jgi:hypothetical protein
MASLALSAAYITIESNHSCVGYHCPVCAHLEAAEMVLQQLVTALLLLIFFSSTIIISQMMLARVNGHSYRFLTLVSQNVRMNN